MSTLTLYLPTSKPSNFVELSWKLEHPIDFDSPPPTVTGLLDFWMELEKVADTEDPESREREKQSLLRLEESEERNDR